MILIDIPTVNGAWNALVSEEQPVWVLWYVLSLRNISIDLVISFVPPISSLWLLPFFGLLQTLQPHLRLPVSNQ